jgi:hypothetical protein
MSMFSKVASGQEMERRDSQLVAGSAIKGVGVQLISREVVALYRKRDGRVRRDASEYRTPARFRYSRLKEAEPPNRRLVALRHAGTLQSSFARISRK